MSHIEVGWGQAPQVRTAAVLADFKVARALIERKNGILRRFHSMGIARYWRERALLEGYLCVFSNAFLAPTNMMLLRVLDRLNGVPLSERQGRLGLIAGYVVNRRRKRHSKSKGPPVVGPATRLAA